MPFDRVPLFQVGDRVVVVSLQSWRTKAENDGIIGCCGTIRYIFPAYGEISVWVDGHAQLDPGLYGHDGSHLLMEDNLQPVLPLLDLAITDEASQ